MRRECIIINILKLYEVEDELNKQFKTNASVNKEDLQLFVDITSDSYYPLPFARDENDNIKITFDNYDILGKNIYVGTKKQFLYKRVNISADTHKLNLNYNELKTAWDPKKYHIFLNGYLLNSSLYKIAIPGLDNFYSKKVLYSLVKLSRGNRLDIFYIENGDAFSDVPFNRDMFIALRKVMADQETQTVFQIPYPYKDYPRGENMFFVTDKNGTYMDNRRDYTVSEDGEYISLANKNMIENPLIDFLIFTFPYVRADWETTGMETEDSDEDNYKFGEETGIRLLQSYSLQANSNGLVTFSPTFSRYSLNKGNVILFGNSTFIDPSRYELTSNATIQFNNDVDKARCQYGKYTMLIFEEIDKSQNELLEFELEVRQVVADRDKQAIFSIPEVDIEHPSFMAFLGSTSLDIHDRFKWDEENYIMVLQDDEDYVTKGRAITFIFYKPLLPTMERDKEIMIKKVYFEPTKNGEALIPKDQYKKGFIFSNNNLVLFLNGTYLQPDRYNVDSNGKITMNDPTDDAITVSKSLTGMYLESYVPTINSDSNNSEDIDSIYKYINMVEDNDWIIFDEMYSKAQQC